MLFRFLSIVKPGWYFNLKPLHDPNLNPQNSNTEEVAETFEDISFYDSRNARINDLGFQAFMKGEGEPFSNLHLKHNRDIPLIDEYRFLRRYFRNGWSLYVLLFRLFWLRNPLKELRAFYESGNIRKVELFKKVKTFPEYKNFNSNLVKAQPKVSIVIPTLNRYAYLKDGLHDLEKQDFRNIEVWVVDQSEAIKPGFYEQFNLNINVIHQHEKALWRARNEAIRQANGDYILLYDDDSRVETDWVRQHLKCLDYFQADVSAGVSFSQVGGQIPESYYHFRYADQFDTGNAMVRKDVFYTTGLFDRQFEKQRMGDGEFGLRAYLHGFWAISNPYASRLHLKVGEGGLREMGSWDAFRPKNLLAPRPVPSVLYYYRQYFPKENVYSALIQGTLPSLIPYQFKGNKKLLPIGLLIGLLFSPFLMIGVVRSWRKASQMLKEGPLIDHLETTEYPIGD